MSTFASWAEHATAKAHLHAQEVLADPVPWAAAVEAMVAIRDLRADLADLYSEMEQKVAEHAPRQFNVEGIGDVQVRKATRRTQWRKDELLAAVVARICDERYVLCDDDGEVFPTHEVARRVVARLRECIYVGGGKVGGLKGLGLAADEFCTVDEGHLSVQLPPRGA